MVRMSSSPLRIAFFGTPEFAVPSLRELARSRHPVVGVITQPDRPRGRGQHVQPGPVKTLAQELGLTVMQPERIREPGFLDAFRALEADLAVVAAYGKILPADLIAIPRHGFINVHASLLPRWRGASPIQHAVAHGDAETGVTIMRIVAALDAGAMFARRSRPIGADETAGDVERALAELGAPVLVDVVEQLAAGTATETPQDEALVTYAPRLTKEDGRIDWTRTAEQLQCFVRGMQPWPGAITWNGEHRWLVRRAEVLELPAPAPSGTIVEASSDRIAVACGGGTVLGIRELQPEGKRAMTAREFLAGHQVAPGTVLAAAP